jgi:ABC-2 type transport system permease protein
MRKFWVVVAREYLERVRSRWFLVATILGPVVFGGISIGQIVLTEHAQTSPDLSNIVIVDATGVGLGARVRPRLAGSLWGDTSVADVRLVTAAALPAAESTALHEVMRRERIGYLVLDDSTLAGVRARYSGWNTPSPADVEHINRAVRDALFRYRLEGAGLDPVRAETILRLPLTIEADRVTDAGHAGSGLVSAAFGYVVAFVLYMMIVLYGQTILRGVMEEKTTRVAEVVVASVPSDTLLAGKVLGVGGVALTQEFVWIAASLGIFAARGPILAYFGVYGAGEIALPTITLGAGITLVLFFVLGFMFYASLFAAVGSMVSSPEDAQQAALPVTLLLVSTIALVVPVLLAPSGGLARAMSWIPFSAPIIMPLRMTVMQVPWPEVAGSLVVLALACVGAVWVASRIYRVGLLMYGKRPSLREVARWIRAA